MQATKKIWIDGELLDWDSATTHVLSPSLHYGLGVFEGIRSYARPDGSSVVLRLHDHMRRLVRSAAICAINLRLTAEDASEAVTALLAANDLPSAYIRPVVFLPPSHLGLNHASTAASVAIACWQWENYLGADATRRGIRTTISSWKHADALSAPVGAKSTGQYLTGYLAKADATRVGYDEAILVNRDGNVVESTSQNIFVVRDDVLLTPPVADGCLPGITRDCVIRIAEAEGLEWREASIPRSHLFDCDEAFVTGTLSEIVPISEVDGRSLRAPGPITGRLLERFTRLLYLGEQEFNHWFTRVRVTDNSP